MIIQSIKRVQQALKKRNLDPLPVEHYGPYLSKEQIGKLTKMFVEVVRE